MVNTERARVGVQRDLDPGPFRHNRDMCLRVIYHRVSLNGDLEFQFFIVAYSNIRHCLRFNQESADVLLDRMICAWNNTYLQYKRLCAIVSRNFDFTP
jgi:hypothetical protein